TPLNKRRQSTAVVEWRRRTKQDDKSTSSPAVSVLRVPGYRSWLATRRSADYLQETWHAGESIAVLDLPPLRCRTLSACSRALQVHFCEVGHTETVPQIKDKLRRCMKWQKDDHPETAWCESGTMAAGKAAL